MKKLKTYVLMLAHSFPVHHYQKGESTQFYGKALAGTKIHTVRINAKNWAYKIDEVNAGRAIISVRQWSGKPYEKGSDQIELFQMHKCGYELIEKSDTMGIYVVNNFPSYQFVEYQEGFGIGLIPRNDGLTVDEFNSWFAKTDTREYLIIIHFTDFRYTNDHHDGVEKYLIPTLNGMQAL